MLASSTLMAVALSDWKFQLCSETTTSLSDNASKVVQRSSSGRLVLRLIRSQKTLVIVLSPLAHIEFYHAQGQDHPLNKAKAIIILLGALLAELLNIRDQTARDLDDVKSLDTTHPNHAWAHLRVTPPI